MSLQQFGSWPQDVVDNVISNGTPERAERARLAGPSDVARSLCS